MKILSLRERHISAHLIKHRAKPQKLVVHTIEGIYIIKRKRITHLLADSNYTSIYLDNGNKITTSKTLKFYESILNEDFIRIHQSSLINPNYVTWINNNFSSLMINDTIELRISRSKKAIVKNLLDHIKH